METRTKEKIVDTAKRDDALDNMLCEIENTYIRNTTVYDNYQANKRQQEQKSTILKFLEHDHYHGLSDDEDDYNWIHEGSDSDDDKGINYFTR